MVTTPEMMAIEIARLHTIINDLLQHCEDGECAVCGAAVCPCHEPLHFHHDGCPSCEFGSSDKQPIVPDLTQFLLTMQAGWQDIARFAELPDLQPDHARVMMRTRARIALDELNSLFKFNAPLANNE